MSTADTTVTSPAERTTASDADPRLGADARALHRVMSDLLRLAQFRDRDRICCHDISVTQCYALETLVQRGPSTLAALAEALLLDKSTVSRVVDALERKGYAVRRPHPDDRRALLLEPTVAGRRLHARIDADLVHEMEHVLADFPAEVRQGMTRLLGRLARASAARLGGESCGSVCCGTGEG